MNTELPAPLILGPNSAVLTISLGITGIYAEFCRPGRAIPGALGLALAMLGLASLLRYPLAAPALLCIAIAAALLVLEGLVPSRGICTLLAAGAMAWGLRSLIDAPDPAPHILWSTAVGIGLPLTLATGFLLSAAMAGRRAKTSRQDFTGARASRRGDILKENGRTDS